MRLAPADQSHLGGHPDKSDAVPSPDAVLIVVRDLAAWWEDCGCSGSAKGGASRFASLALGAPNAHFLFVGRTVLPFANENSSLNAEQLNAHAPWYLSLAAEVFGAMGDNVSWVPDELEKQALAQHAVAAEKVSAYALAGRELSWQGMTVTILDGEAIAVSGVRQTLPFPQPRNRGRDVGLLAVWEHPESTETRFEPRLASMLLLQSRSKETRARTRELLLNRSESVVAHWRQQVAADLVEDSAVQQASERGRLVASHIPGQGSTYLESNGRESTVRVLQEECAACHQEAFAVWSKSRHAGSMDTLRSRIRHKDPRCLPCHSRAHETDVQLTKTGSGHDAVTCGSCHKNGVKPEDTCRNCHNQFTDPSGHYKLKLTTICPGGSDRSVAGSCSRE